MLGALSGMLLEVDGCSKSFGWVMAAFAGLMAMASAAVFGSILLEASFKDSVALAVVGVMKLHGIVLVTNTQVGCTELLLICTTES